MNKSVKQMYLYYFNNELSLFKHYLLDRIENNIDPYNSPLNKQDLEFIQSLLKRPFKNVITKTVNNVTKPLMGKILILVAAIGYLLYISDDK